MHRELLTMLGMACVTCRLFCLYSLGPISRLPSESRMRFDTCNSSCRVLRLGTGVHSSGHRSQGHRILMAKGVHDF